MTGEPALNHTAKSYMACRRAWLDDAAAVLQDVHLQPILRQDMHPLQQPLHKPGNVEVWPLRMVGPCNAYMPLTPSIELVAEIVVHESAKRCTELLRLDTNFTNATGSQQIDCNEVRLRHKHSSNPALVASNLENQLRS